MVERMSRARHYSKPSSAPANHASGARLQKCNHSLHNTLGWRHYRTTHVLDGPCFKIWWACPICRMQYADLLSYPLGSRYTGRSRCRCPRQSRWERCDVPLWLSKLRAAAKAPPTAKQITRFYHALQKKIGAPLRTLLRWARRRDGRDDFYSLRRMIV
jgi:hypothetical protein